MLNCVCNCERRDSRLLENSERNLSTMPEFAPKDSFGTGEAEEMCVPMFMGQPDSAGPVLIGSLIEVRDESMWFAPKKIAKSRGAPRGARNGSPAQARRISVSGVKEALMSFGLEEVERFLEVEQQEEYEDFVNRGYFLEEREEYGSYTQKRRSKRFRGDEDDEDFDPALEESLCGARRESISKEYMCKVLDYMEKHPSHSFKTISRKFGRVRHQSQLARFKKCRENSVRQPNRYLELARFCNAMCDETEARGERVDKSQIRIWALQKAEELGLLRFGASDAWVYQFRQKRSVSR